MDKKIKKWSLLLFTLQYVIPKQNASIIITGEKFTRTVNNQRLEGAEIYGQSSSREVECIFNCASHPKCLSINYHAERKWCILNSGMELSEKCTMVDHIGWRYFEKTTDTLNHNDGQLIAFEKDRTTSVRQNKLLTKIAKMPKQWTLSFKVYVEPFTPTNTNIINFVTRQPGEISEQILSVGLKDSITNKFTMAWQSIHQKSSESQPVLRQYTSMDISSFEFNNSFHLLWNIDRRRQYSATVEDPTKTTNVFLFLSAPSLPSLNGKVRHLKFAEQPSEGKEIKPKLLETIRVLPTHWYIFFTFTLTEYVSKDWATIVHFKKKGIGRQQPELGSDLPAFHLNRVSKKLEFALATKSMNAGNVFRYKATSQQPQINVGEKYHVHTEMRNAVGGGCHLVSKVNNLFLVNLSTGCVDWNDVEVWIGGPWNDIGVSRSGIKLSNFKYGFL